jgi:hypothetical protein
MIPYALVILTIFLYIFYPYTLTMIFFLFFLYFYRLQINYVIALTVQIKYCTRSVVHDLLEVVIYGVPF